MERVARIVRDQNADVVAIQELDRFWERSSFEDQPAKLARLLGLNMRFGANLVQGSSEYGVAVFTRHPVIESRNHSLGTPEGWEPRGVLEVVVDVPVVGRVTILNTHLQQSQPGFGEAAFRQRRAGADFIAARIGVIDGPVVLMGDFNAEPGDEELAPLGHFADAWSVGGDGTPGQTIPARPDRAPEKRIDAIYVTDAFSIERVRVVRNDPTRVASDHYPVVADLVCQTR